MIEDDESKFVIKIASNNLTAVERVIGWPDIISEYKKLGCYSPKMYKSIYGNYAETVLFRKGFVLYGKKNIPNSESVLLLIRRLM